MVKSCITRSMSCAGVAAADAEAIVTVGICSIRMGAENVESINVGFP